MLQKKFLAIACMIALVIVCGWFLRLNDGDLGSDATDIASAGHTVIKLPGTVTTHSKFDPANDSWPTEVAHDAIKAKLKKISENLLSGQLDNLDSFTVESFSTSGDFQRDAATTVFTDSRIEVHRVDGATGRQSDESSFRKFLELFTNATQSIDRCMFKVVRIEPRPDAMFTSVLVEMRSAAPNSIQINATWNCIWQMGDVPKIASIAVEGYEWITLSGRNLFTDVTEAVLSKTTDYERHILRGIDHWCERMCSIDDMRIFGHHGIAVADVNGDGLEDVYVCDAGGLPNRLYIQNADGTATDYSEKSNTNWLESTTSALLIDLDNDGDSDLVAATVAGIIFAANNGKGIFQIRNAFTGAPEAHTMCAADYDNDLDLDIYVCNYGASGGAGSQRGYEATAPVPYNDANNGGPNLLLQNNGNFQFSDVAKSVGLDQNNRRFSFAASWEDFDRDGDSDLYVANDFGRNNLYENLGGRFVDIASSAGVEDMAGGMSVAWGDVNRDGIADIYVGNMFSAAGNRVTYQRKFTDQHAAQSEGMQRMARGNTLFISTGNGSFNDVSESAAVTMGRWAWSSRFCDVNNDGWEDIVVANGYFTNTDTNDL